VEMLDENGTTILEEKVLDEKGIEEVAAKVKLLRKQNV
jgi:hypothetical protein